ncbi:MAG: PAS domain S-box protein [Bacteroidota bacterium]
MTCILYGPIDGEAATTLQETLAANSIALTPIDNTDTLQELIASTEPLVLFFTTCDPDILALADTCCDLNQKTVLKVLLYDATSTNPLKLPCAAHLDDVMPWQTSFDARLHYLIHRARRRAAAYKTASALETSQANAHAVLDTTVDGIITIDEDRIIQSYNRAAEQIFGYTEDEVIGNNVNMLMPPPFREEHDGYVKSYHETNHKKIIGIGREVRGLRKNGEVFPMELAVSEIKHLTHRTYTGIIRDISVRRELEVALLHASEEERRRIGQDLHDGLGQMLTGIGLIAKNMAKSLATEHPESSTGMFELVELVKSADEQARSISRSLIPIELENGGLKAAILRLGVNIERLYGIPCDYKETGPMPDISANVKTHFFRIVQEAINNAAKHSKASRITTAVASSKNHLRAHIQDNGIGIDLQHLNGRGMGLRIMQHRANVIGASLQVRPGTPGGTTITCTLPLST